MCVCVCVCLTFVLNDARPCTLLHAVSFGEMVHGAASHLASHLVKWYMVLHAVSFHLVHRHRHRHRHTHTPAEEKL